MVQHHFRREHLGQDCIDLGVATDHWHEPHGIHAVTDTHVTLVSLLGTPPWMGRPIDIPIEFFCKHYHIMMFCERCSGRDAP